ncbi:hypothetical protein II906_12150 [bacterium]|nr:hypothetical protein [bacterium]
MEVLGNYTNYQTQEKKSTNRNIEDTSTQSPLFDAENENKTEKVSSIPVECIVTDKSKEKKDGFFKKIWNGIKSGAKSVWDFITSPFKKNKNKGTETTETTTEPATKPEPATKEAEQTTEEKPTEPEATEPKEKEQEEELWDGSFILDGHKHTYSWWGSNELQNQKMTYNDDDTATVEVFNKNDEGCDDIADEIYTIKLDHENEQIEVIDTQFNIDKKIDYVSQGTFGDCWLIASLNAISATEEGQKIIEDAISINDDGTYSVTFEGIGETYTVTKEELTKARNVKGYLDAVKFSTGDNTILLFEVAVKKAFDEMVEDYKNGKEFSNESKATLAKVMASGWNDSTSYDPDNYGASTSVFAHLFSLKHIWDGPNKVVEFNGDDSIRFGETIDVVKSDRGDDFEIVKDHQYFAKSYDEEKGTISVVNPWDTSDSFTTTVDELEQYGVWISGVSTEHKDYY